MCFAFYGGGHQKVFESLKNFDPVLQVHYEPPVFNQLIIANYMAILRVFVRSERIINFCSKGE